MFEHFFAHVNSCIIKGAKTVPVLHVSTAEVADSVGAYRLLESL